MISAIIPVYNHAHTLERCLESLFLQTYRPLEVIIVNDGSKDNFAEVISDLKNKFDFHVINQENKGAPAARNRGVLDAKGDYMIFWDADTIAKPEMLEKMMTALENNPLASYAYSQFKFGWKKMKSNKFDPDLLKKMNYIDATSLIKRQDFPVEGWDEKIKRFQDWDLWLTMLESGQTGVFVPEVLYRKIVEGRKGISNWLPGFIFRLPLKFDKIDEYENARRVILDKHNT